MQQDNQQSGSVKRGGKAALIELWIGYTTGSQPDAVWLGRCITSVGRRAV